MEWYWWLFIAVVFVLFIVRWVIPVQNHPSHKLGKQGSSMGWYAAGTSKDEQGFRNLRVSKGGMQAVISFANGNVILVHPPIERPFKDFVELEEFLHRPPPSPPARAAAPPAPKVDLEKGTIRITTLSQGTLCLRGLGTRSYCKRLSGLSAGAPVL